ncbi:uncharacterized protein G2W53_018199 [Senna tora]|uniref:Uncharacterized protein n=1 Tax=Senna tora TaxID=362788 RepID=A0A834TVE6_9FABA|nr:uncharacterized protein G2W53_018199 [Senna tora]
MHGVGGEGKQVEGIVGMFKVKGPMAFWYFGSGERYGTFKEEGKVFADKADVFRIQVKSARNHARNGAVHIFPSFGHMSPWLHRSSKSSDSIIPKLGQCKS